MTYKDFDINYLEDMTSLFIKAFNCEPWNDKWTSSLVNKRLLQLINCNGFYGMLAFENDKLVGLILGIEEYTFDDKEFVIKEFCVDNNIKGKGIGTKIILEFEKRLRDKSFSKITLMTLRNNATMGFYEKRFYSECENLVMMEKKISC